MAYTPSKGTLVKQGSTTCIQVVNVQPCSIENSATEVTHLGSTWAEFMATIPDGGSMTFTIEYDPTSATHTSITTSLVAGTQETWSVTLADSGACVFTGTGFVTNFSPSVPDVRTGIVTADVTIKFTGTVSINP